MVSSTVTTLKFVGSISLGLLTGVGYTLSTLTIPSLIASPTAGTASKSFADLRNWARSHLQRLTCVSTGAFLIAFLFSPRNAKHPYLLWTSAFVAGGHIYDVYSQVYNTPEIAAAPKTKKTTKRTVEQSYDTLGDSHSDATESDDLEEDVNGEEVKAQMEQFGRDMTRQTFITGVGFAMSLIGLWGDGA